MDQQRALLDELMGVSRDGEREEYITTTFFGVEVARKFTDPDVCKYYIQGFCFMDEFQRTKHHYGDCDKVHDEECKAQWEKLDDAEKAQYPYERELWEWLEKFSGDLRSKVKRNQERISSVAEVPLMSSDQARLTELDDEIKKLVRESEELGESGDVDAAQNAATQADRLKTERVSFEAEAKARAQDSLNRYGEQQVCELSGVIINNEESRLRDHKSGKNYRTWLHVHEKRKELEETFKRRGAQPTLARSSSRDKRSEDRPHHRDRDRSRERERRREPSRNSDRDRDRYRERSGHRSYERSYSGSRHRR